MTEPTILRIEPVIPSADVQRDMAWYHKFTGFEVQNTDRKYAVLKRENQFIHLQWHADTEDDPLLGGSVVKIFVNNIKPYFDEFVTRGTVDKEKLHMNTPWGTHEFGFYDLNKNAIFIVQDA